MSTLETAQNSDRVVVTGSLGIVAAPSLTPMKTGDGVSSMRISDLEGYF